MNDHLREELNALVDGELDAGRAAELRRRMETDGELRREFESLRRTAEAVRGLPRPPAPPSLRTRLASSLDKAPGGRVLRLRPWMAVAAVLLVAVAGTSFVLLSQGTSPGPSHEEARNEKVRDARDEGAPVKAAERDAPDEAVPADALERPAAPAAEALLREKETADALPRDREAVLEELAAKDRTLYLRRLGELPPAELRAHILRVAPPEEPVFGEAKDDTAAWPEVITPDRETAVQLYAVLNRLQEPAPAGALAVQAPPAPPGPVIVATVEGTEQDLRRIEGWLMTFRVAEERRQDTGRALRGASKARAEAKAESEAAAEAQDEAAKRGSGGAGAGAPSAPAPKRIARFRLTWPPAMPVPEPPPPPPGQDGK